MKHPFSFKGIDQILELVDLSELQASGAAANRLYYDGDHWQNGDAWIGPQISNDNPDFSAVMSEVQRVFCSRNVIKEVVDRKVDGLLKRTPRMDYLDTSQDTSGLKQTDLSKEAVKFFTKWAKRRSLLKKLKQVHGRSQLAEAPVLRFYVPSGLLTRQSGSTTFIPTGDIEQCLDMLHLEVVHSGAASEVVDTQSQLSAMVYESNEDDIEYKEVVYEEEGDTVIRTRIRGNDEVDEDQEYEWRLPLGGRLTMMSPRLSVCITEQIRQNQNAVNLSKTMMNRNTVTAGFVERIILDAMPPGHWEENPENPDNPTFIVSPFKIGPGTTNFMMAAEYRNDTDGEKWFGSPSVNYHDPCDPEVFIKAWRACYQDVLEEVGQTHVLISGDAVSSGSSREQAREIFHGTLDDDENEINRLLEWVMETSLNLAAYLAGEPNRYVGLTAEAKCLITLGPLSGTDRQDTRLNVQAGLMSIQEAMARDGIENPRAELERIRDEEESSLVGLKKKVELWQMLTLTGVDPIKAASISGFTEEQAAQMEIVNPPSTGPQQQLDPQTEDKIDQRQLEESGDAPPKSTERNV